MAIKTGKVGSIYINSDRLTFTTEATTEDGATKIYQIDDATKRTWDPNTPITVSTGTLDKTYYDDGVNWFEGKVKMTAAGLVALTVTGKSMTIRQVGKIHSWALNFAYDSAEKTEIGDTWKQMMALGKSASLTISRYRFDTLFDNGEGGYQENGLSSKVDATETGLATTTQYYFKVDIDGAGAVEYDITTVADTTFDAVITLMNAEVTGAYFSLVGGDLRCTSETNGSTSSIALSAGTTGTDLFATLTGWTAFGEAVDGSLEQEYYLFKLYEDAAAGFWFKALPSSVGLTKTIGAIDQDSLSFEVSANVGRF